MIPDEARLMGEHHLRVVPIGPGTKHPPIPEWQKRATSDAETHAAWWDPHPEWGIGWKMGLQDDGRFLIAIDVDIDKGGKETLQLLFDESPDLREEFRATVRAVTGRDGAHFVFELPPGAPHPTNRAHLRPGIDIRAENGQIVVQPTLHPDTGRMYRWVIDHQPWIINPCLAGAATMQLLADVTAPVPLRVVSEREPLWRPGQGEGETPADWVRRTQDYTTYLVKHGWDQVGFTSWRRPDKTDRGSSAELKDDGLGPLNIFTTDVPEALRALGTPDSTGQCITVSLFDFIAAYEFDGDRSACAAHFRRVMNELAGVTRAAVVRAETAAAPAERDDTSPMRLPQVEDWYWSATALKAQIHQAAWNRRVSPDALDLTMYVLQSCLVPPGFMIESPVGPQPLNMLACLVASTGDFKTNTLGAGLDLLGPFPPWVDTIGMGSGEGIGAMFLKEEEVTDAKTGKTSKTGRWVRNDLRAVFFEADEGSGMSQQAGRQGATVIANLCKAWSGSMLGEGNANLATRRRVLRNDYRIGAYVNIQPSNFGLLFSEANTGTGLTGRFMFSGTLDETMPDERPEWPGPIEFPVWHQGPRLITMDPKLLAEADAAVVHRHRTGGLTTANPLSQVAATTARIAALNALSEDRFHVTTDDYALARVRAEASARALTVLDQYFGVVQSDKGHRAVEAKARASADTDEAVDRIWLKKTTDRVMAVLQAGPMSSGHIQARLSAKQRPYLDEALTKLIDIGQIRLVGERYERT